MPGSIISPKIYFSYYRHLQAAAVSQPAAAALAAALAAAAPAAGLLFGTPEAMATAQSRAIADGLLAAVSAPPKRTSQFRGVTRHARSGRWEASETRPIPPSAHGPLSSD